MNPRSIVFLHAHPDDEACMTAGTMAKEAASGSDVYLITATNGSVDIASRKTVSDRPISKREEETVASAEILGVKKTWFLGYRDSGMAGTPPNFDSDSFFQSDAFTAAEQVRSICQNVGADILVGYEPNGTYGHPDHIKCHIVGSLAAQKMPHVRFLWSTLNRDSYEMLRVFGGSIDSEWARRLTSEFWCPASEITHKIDVSMFMERKREAILAHETEISEDHIFASMSDSQFVECFGSEWYSEHGMKQDWRISPEGDPVIFGSFF